MIVFLLVAHLLASGIFVANILKVSKQSFIKYMKAHPPAHCTPSLYKYLREPYKKSCPIPASDMWPKTWPYVRAAQGLCIFSQLIKRSFVVSVNINNKKKVFLCHYL